MRPYLRVTLAYLLFGIVWIFFSDRVVEHLFTEAVYVTFVQTIKGWLFIGISSLLLFFVSRRAFNEHMRTEREKLAIFNKTVEGSYHILLNYLNQMQLVTLEAEACRDFDREILRLSTLASDEATRELRKLGEVHIVTAENIDAVIYENIRKA